MLLACLSVSTLYAQDMIRGRVLHDNNGIKSPLPGANVYYADQSAGASTDLDGIFSLEFTPGKPLLISYIGFETDTLYPKNAGDLGDLTLTPAALDEVVVEAKTEALKINTISAENITIITNKELAKAPCCNLAESFETNAGVDASFSDAATGQRQISMIGLTGIYAQFMQGNMPSLRSGYAMQGLNFIPGPWINSIQISKGAGSVLNGFESITGQINYELRQPTDEELVFVNVYANGGSRLEFNGALNLDVSKGVSTGIYVHGNNVSIKNDNNNDGYLDMPTGSQINLMNRWQLYKGNWEAQAGIHFVQDERTGGFADYDFSQTHAQNKIEQGVVSGDLIASTSDKSFLRAFAKAGWVNPEKTWQSVGFQAAYTNYTDSLRYSFGDFTAKEQNYYFNAIYSSELFNCDLPFKAGLSLLGDHVDQSLFRRESILVAETVITTLNNNTIGAFFEQTIKAGDMLTLMLGLRADYVAMHDTVIVSPRLHVRYSPAESLTLRANAGLGYRQPRPLANNLGLLMATNGLMINHIGDLGTLPLEEGFNTGVGFVWKRELDYRPFSLTGDLFYTTFFNRMIYSRENLTNSGPTTQLLADFRTNSPSYTLGALVEANYEVFRRFDARISYRYTQSVENQNYGGGVFLNEFSYFLPFHKGMVNLAYATKKSIKGAHWVFDATWQWIGEQRIPQALNYVTANSRNRPSTAIPFNETRTPSYSLVHLQVTRHFSNRLNVYAGVDNALDIVQNPVITQTGTNTEATNIFAPVFGRMFYLGLKFNMLKPKK